MGLLRVWRSAIALNATLERTPVNHQGAVARTWAQNLGLIG
jgi:hypothetical protein